MASPGKIKFFFPHKTSLTERGRLKVFIEKIFRKEGKNLGGLNYVFCSDKELLRLNRDYLNHDYYTDIITFDLSEPKGPILAEIHISTDRVWDNAKELGISFKKELHRVIFHGVLHLCGLGDKTSKDEALMRKREDHYLRQYL
jgi:probable rRNA maturation factor